MQFYIGRQIFKPIGAVRLCQAGLCKSFVLLPTPSLIVPPLQLYRNGLIACFALVTNAVIILVMPDNPCDGPGGISHQAAVIAGNRLCGKQVVHNAVMECIRKLYGAIGIPAAAVCFGFIRQDEVFPFLNQGLAPASQIAVLCGISALMIACNAIVRVWRKLCYAELIPGKAVYIVNLHIGGKVFKAVYAVLIGNSFFCNARNRLPAFRIGVIIRLCQLYRCAADARFIGPVSSLVLDSVIILVFPKLSANISGRLL